jgi:lipopolysaccharide transport system permease protein
MQDVLPKRGLRSGMPAATRIARSLWLNRALAWETAKRELQAINKGTLLGLGWLIVRPGIQACAYIVIVSYVFSVRYGPDAGHFTYALYVLSGLAPWQLSARVLEDAPSLIRVRMEVLKQVIYPLEILPITSMVIASVGPLLLLAMYIVLGALSGGLHWTLIFLPLPAILLALLLLGGAWVLMVLGMILVDLREVIGVIFGLIVYLSPAVLAETMVPPGIWNLVQFNPLSHVIICFRDVFDAQLHLLSWGIFAGMAAVTLALGTVALSGAKQIFGEYA